MMRYTRLLFKHTWIRFYKKVTISNALSVCIIFRVPKLITHAYAEGGRSRTGKLLQPKFGILSFLLESVLSGQVEDAIICPVSTQYDKVLEVDSYISELLGQPKAKESLGNFLSSSSVLSLKLGRVDVRFHEPWSLRDFVNEQKLRLPPQIKSPEDIVLKRRLLTTLGYKVLSDINAVSVVMPTALIGTVLLTLRGRGAGKSELVRRVEWLTERVKRQGGRIAHFAGLPTTLVVERGLEVLGPKLVGETPGLAEKTYYAADRFQLSFYRNMTIHLFVSEALVSAALYTKVKLGGGPEHQSISYMDLYEYVYFLSQVSLVAPQTNPMLTPAALPWRIHLPYYATCREPHKHAHWTRSGQHYIHPSV